MGTGNICQGGAAKTTPPYGDQDENTHCGVAVSACFRPGGDTVRHEGAGGWAGFCSPSCAAAIPGMVAAKCGGATTLTDLEGCLPVTMNSLRANDFLSSPSSPSARSAGVDVLGGFWPWLWRLLALALALAVDPVSTLLIMHTMLCFRCSIQLETRRPRRGSPSPRP